MKAARVFSIALISLFSVGTSFASDRVPWCSSEIVGNIGLGIESSDIKAIPIASSSLRKSKQLLQSRTLVEISSKQASHFSGTHLPGGRLYYLVRSGAFVGLKGSILDANAQGNMMHRRFYWRIGDRLLSIFNMQVWKEAKRLISVPLLITTTSKVNKVRAFCESFPR
jgi:hypothetical protein